jgi:uncharacterized protein (TIGR02266 family)
MAEGNRKDPRARVLNMTVRYKSATVDEFIENHSHDISRGGIFIKTRSPFPAGTLLKFEVRIAEDQKLMHGVGRVVWRREADRAEESFPAGMGIKFIKTGEGAADLINQLVAARQGVESSFDAGVRENVNTPSGGRPSAVPGAPALAASRPSSVPTSAPFVSVDSPARSLTADAAETAVTNPAKKRQDQAPEKRKVVLQGPALESPSSKPKPSPTANVGDSAPSRERSRASIAEETTARRARPTAQSDDKRLSFGGMVVIVALVGLVVFVVNRLRGPGAPPEPAPVVNAERPAPLPPAPPAAVEANPAREGSSDDPSAAGTAPPNAVDTTPTGTTAEVSATEPSGMTAPAPNAPASAGAVSPAADAPAVQPGDERPASAAPPAPPSPAASPSAAAPPSAAAAPSAAAPPAAATPAPAPPPPAPKAAAPAPAKPAPAKPPPPPPRATAAPKPATPPAAAPQPAPPSESAKPSEPTPPATAGSGGEASTATPPRAKKPSAPPPSEPAPPPPSPPPANDNPY